MESVRRMCKEGVWAECGGEEGEVKEMDRNS